MSEADWGALEPYFDDAIVFVEWPEAAGGVAARAARSGYGYATWTRRGG